MTTGSWIDLHSTAESVAFLEVLRVSHAFVIMSPIFEDFGSGIEHNKALHFHVLPTLKSIEGF